MKTMLVLSMGALLLAGTLSAQTPVPEWQAGVDKVKNLIQSNPAQASEEAGELLKGKNKKNVDLVTSVAHVYLDAGKITEAQEYLAMAKKANNKDPKVSVLEGDIALAQKNIGQACQLFNGLCRAGRLISLRILQVGFLAIRIEIDGLLIKLACLSDIFPGKSDVTLDY